MKIKLLVSMALLFSFFLAASYTASGQDMTITGKVLDEAGVPVIGASVIESGTQNGAITDLDGNYILEVGPGSTIEISSIGFKSVTLQVTETRTVYDVTLAQDTELLDEVVVVGYGTMKRRDHQ